MRNATEKLQHRRHRPMYLAPSAVHMQHFAGRSNDSAEILGYCDDDGDDKTIEDLRIPLLVEIPHDDNLRIPVISPPSSGGSEVSMLLSPITPPLQHKPFQSPSIQQPYESSSHRPFRQRLYRAISSVYYVISDFLLLVFVCLMGLFFDVEVQVVKHRTRGRSGRVIVRNCSIPVMHRQRQYQSTDLLRPLQPRSTPSPFLMPDDMV